MANFFKNLGKAIEEKNRRAASLNRIRVAIRCEERAAQKEYETLGRYYYNNLRDKGDLITEPHCAQLDKIEARLDSALEMMTRESNKIGIIQSSGQGCPCEEDCCEEIDLDDVESFDQDPELEAEAIAEESAPAHQAKSEPLAHQAEAAEPQTDCSLPFEG